MEVSQAGLSRPAGRLAGVCPPKKNLKKTHSRLTFSKKAATMYLCAVTAAFGRRAQAGGGLASRPNKGKGVRQCALRKRQLKNSYVVVYQWFIPPPPP
ncbi:MAG: hypothetical protein FWG66_09965, partial [Spirochaetes bacterium]|nr:hypothetical protein [Spirochaetota bacterium]